MRETQSLTHTGSIVSDQYIKICREHKCKIAAGVMAGKRLRASPKYFETAVETVYEVGLKLCYVLWRKFDKETEDKADGAFNARCFELIAAQSYRLAEALLRFSHTVPRLTDRSRRVMIVNLANAIRLQGRLSEATQILDTEDWSATSDDFKICVAAVKENTDEVLRLMDHVGNRIEADDYRTWPVFLKLRDDARFIEKFESIFGEPFVMIRSDSTLSVEESQTTGSESDSEPTKTIH